MHTRRGCLQVGQRAPGVWEQGGMCAWYERAGQRRKGSNPAGCRRRLWFDSNLQRCVSHCEMHAKPRQGDALKEIKREELRLALLKRKISRDDAKPGIVTQ
jgi:hypothetical protein